MPDELEWRRSSVAFFVDGRSWPFNGPLDLLRFAPLSPSSRLRMGLAVLRLQRRAARGEGVGPYEGISAADWVRREMGAQAWEKVWGPLLGGKFGSRAEEISMSWLWNKLTARRQLRGDEARVEKLGYPRGSWEPLFAALAARIEAGGGRVLIDRPVKSVSGAAGVFKVTPGAAGSFQRGHAPTSFAADGPAKGYDAVVATVPNDVFEELLDDPLAAEIGAPYLTSLRRIDYHEALCLLLELDRPLSSFYWTNIAEPGLPFIGVIEHANFIPVERYGGRRFLYVANYLAPGDPHCRWMPTRCCGPTSPGCGRSTPNSISHGCESAGAFASRSRSRS
jgi:protoporphyrinogen oxidase